MFPDRMISLMKQKKITKKQMSEDCGFGINQIKYWQTNLNTPCADTMTKIADRLGTSTMYLLEMTDNPDPLTYIFPIEKDPPLLGKMRVAMREKEDNTPSEVDMAMDKLTASLQEAMDAIEASKSPSVLDRLGDVVKQLSKDDLEELGRYAEYLASKKNN